MSFEENKLYNGIIKGFRYTADYAMITLTIADANASCILGTKADFPIKDLMELKACGSVDVLYKGTKNVNGVDYPKFGIESINF